MVKLAKNIKKNNNLKTLELEKDAHASVCGWWSGCYLQVRWVHHLLPMSVITALVKGRKTPSPLWAVMYHSHNLHLDVVRVLFCITLYCTIFDSCDFVLHYTECNRRNGPDFGGVFLMSYYTDITQNTYIQSSMVTEILAREIWNFDSCYSLIDYQIHIETGRNMWFL